MKVQKHAVALSATVGMLFATTAAMAGEPEKEKATKPKPAVSESRANAMRVMVDPDTGEIRTPDENELRALLEAQRAAEQAQRSARASSQQTLDVLPAEKSVVRHANGMVSVKLGMDSLSALKVQSVGGKDRLVHDGEDAAAAKPEEK